MLDSESIKKLLRSVLQSSKDGVPINRLQSEFSSMCGEKIPLTTLGYSKLEDYLRSIPSVVRLEHRMGELRCFAAVCQETAHIAELVAKQRSSKKSGRSQVVNCRMRFRPSNFNMLSARPRSSLRQPSAGSTFNWAANRSVRRGDYNGLSAAGDYRQFDQKLSSTVPVQHRPPVLRPAVPQKVITNRSENRMVNGKIAREMSPEQVSRPSESQLKFGLYDVKLVQSRIRQVLEKYCSGLWMSKLSEVYSKMFSEKLHPQVLLDLSKWTDICLVEQPSVSGHVDSLIYPPLSPKPPKVPLSSTTNTCPTSSTSPSTISVPISSRPLTPSQDSSPPLSLPASKPRVSPGSPLVKPTFVFSPQPVASSGKLVSPVTLRSPALFPQLTPFVSANGRREDEHNSSSATTHNQCTQPSAPTQPCLASVSTSTVASSFHPGGDVLPLVRATISVPSHSAPGPQSTGNVSAEVRQRIKEVLAVYNSGLWAHALPQIYMDMYKMPFPEHILHNLSLLLDICTVEYPIPNNKKKAILYDSSREDVESTDGPETQQSRSHPLPSGLEVLGAVVPPFLVLPSTQYPSVLVTEAKSSNAVTIRYVGEDYSNAQEAMEEAMQSFYSQSSMQRLLSNPTVGQLAAVRGDDGDELTRGQVLEVIDRNKVKVYYMDYGFSVETSQSNLLELHPDFLSLPFQATNVRLAGLEAFSSNPLVLSSLDKLAVGKILLMETLNPCQQNEMLVAVLYDTSHDDDVNINSTCLKALQDLTMNNPLAVNGTYQGVRITNVCADGILYCQLPSRGAARLTKLLEETETYFISQMTSESLVSRPFTGKVCLARFKGKWARAEITNMFSNRVMEILFMDIGAPTTVEITALREIPPLCLKDFAIIPPQAIKCRMADLPVPEGEWSPEAIQKVKDTVMGSEDCKMKILKLDHHKGDELVYMYLFIGVDSQELRLSVNHRLAQLDLWQKPAMQNDNSVDTDLTALVERLSLSSRVPNSTIKTQQRAEEATSLKNEMQPLPLPPPLQLPQSGQNMDVYVPVVCHPGYFVLQPWQDLHKLVVLMGEMSLYYNETGKNHKTPQIQKGEVYAAQIDKSWYRVQVKGILPNGLVSVYELDHGKHELVSRTLIRPLIEEFRQLSFQAIAAQLAGITPHQWSEEASMLFRNHVEKRALVAKVDSVHEPSQGKNELWECRLTVYLVDTTVQDKDLWIHSIMANLEGELSTAA